MAVRGAADGVIVLEGECPLDDAEALLRLLADAADPVVDWRGCTLMHAALLQILLAAWPALLGPPGSSFLEDFIAPLLVRRSDIARVVDMSE